MTLTATQLITERKEGVIDRTWVAGELINYHHAMSCDLTIPCRRYCYRDCYFSNILLLVYGDSSICTIVLHCYICI